MARKAKKKPAARRKSQATPPTIHRYFVDQFPDDMGSDEMLARLNALGGLGWILIQVTQTGDAVFIGDANAVEPVRLAKPEEPTPLAEQAAPSMAEP